MKDSGGPVCQAAPLLNSCSFELTLRVEHEFKGGRKLSALTHGPLAG